MIGKHVTAAAASITLTTALAGVLVAPSARAATSAPATTTSAAAECGVRAHDGRLWCGNSGSAPTRVEPFHESPITGLLQSTFSYFTCWSPGGLHGGGNTTWYRTVPDWSSDGREGYVPADWVFTPSWFDADPSKYGLRRC
ncbi:hypothetical protein BM536_000955 [Streptomyces phaeoluteigriseus]|uniref:SH3 domain-containing protein n=1 Tax=Streptomyces phaeoluteigriseus TaxID=114686 RepID=A0A1V6MZ27_9ACTN|nr:hypothetical protein [Streptomyces phaeoluteigriseus]OQD57698.1 hypothetical protein BM536_000955 [Streptomyces phaeoluteigriseus]